MAAADALGRRRRHLCRRRTCCRRSRYRVFFTEYSRCRRLDRDRCLRADIGVSFKTRVVQRKGHLTKEF